MSEQHDVTFDNGNTYSVYVDKDATGDTFITKLANKIKDEVGENPLRSMISVGTGISSAIGLYRGHIDSKRIRKIEQKLEELLSKSNRF